MLSIVVAMVVIVALAALVLYYVAFPHRGDEAGSGRWLERRRCAAPAGRCAPSARHEEDERGTTRDDHGDDQHGR